MADDARGVSVEAAGRGRIRAPQDFAAGVCLVVLALLAIWAGADLEQGTLRAMGPGMLPRGIAVLIAVVGVALALSGLLADGERLPRGSLRGPFFVCLGVVAFALAIRSVGLLIAGPLVALISGAASPESRPKEIFAFAVVITLFCVALFKYALGLPIPVLVIPGVIVL